MSAFHAPFFHPIRTREKRVSDWIISSCHPQGSSPEEEEGIEEKEGKEETEKEKRKEGVS